MYSKWQFKESARTLPENGTSYALLCWKGAKTSSFRASCLDAEWTAGALLSIFVLSEASSFWYQMISKVSFQMVVLNMFLWDDPFRFWSFQFCAYIQFSQSLKHLSQASGTPSTGTNRFKVHFFGIFQGRDAGTNECMHVACADLCMNEFRRKQQEKSHDPIVFKRISFVFSNQRITVLGVADFINIMLEHAMSPWL